MSAAAADDGGGNLKRDDAAGGRKAATAPDTACGGPAFRAVIEIRHPHARDLKAAVDADNTPQVRCTIAGDALRCEITVDSLGTLLATVDDLMACLGIAAAVLDGGDGAARTPGAGWP